MARRQKGKTFGLNGIAAPAKPVGGLNGNLCLFGNRGEQCRIVATTATDNQAFDSCRQHLHRPRHTCAGKGGQQRRTIRK
jgi:hypothetical protein